MMHPVLHGVIEFRKSDGGVQLDVSTDSLPYGLHITLHLALILGLGNAGGVDETAIMFGHLTVASVESGVVQIWSDDSAFEIVDYKTLWNTAEELEHADMRRHKTCLILTEGQFDILEAAVRECANEGVECTSSGCCSVK